MAQPPELPPQPFGELRAAVCLASLCQASPETRSHPVLPKLLLSTGNMWGRRK